MRRRLLIALLISFLTSAAFGGAIYEVTCTDEKCGFKSELRLGSVIMAERASGYCTTCKDFVFVEWLRQRPGMPLVAPPVAGEIWDGVTGRTMRLFHCPTCKSLFAEIKRADELKHCPKCSKPSPTTKAVAVED